MPKKLNSAILSQNCLHLIAEYCKNTDISEAAFSRKFEKHNRWISELRRGRSMPTYEEAARMCVLLQTTPEEILVEQADIELVNGLLEQEREKSAKKEPAETDRLNPDYLKLNDANRAAIDAAIAALLASQQQGD